MRAAGAEALEDSQKKPIRVTGRNRQMKILELNSITASAPYLQHAGDEVGVVGTLRPQEVDGIGKPYVRQAQAASVYQQRISAEGCPNFVDPLAEHAPIWIELSAPAWHYRHRGNDQANAAPAEFLPEIGQ